jgi:4-hydroxybenzoate polyprenyltransferase
VNLVEKLDHYERLMRLNKPIGILLLLWPTLWALWLAAPGVIRMDVLMIFVLGTVLMRSAGCVINDYADRNIDPQVRRTRDRPLATGQVKPGEALVLAAVLLALAFALVLQLHRLAIYLSFAGLAVTVVYPYLKRFFVFPQAALGIAFSFGIPMAYAAQRGMVPLAGWVMMAAAAFWIIAYDTEYAMVDRDDDITLGVHSSAILLGRYDVAAVMTCHAVFLAIMTWIGLWHRLSVYYYLGLVLAAALVGYQYWLIRGRDRERCFKAFLSNNWVGMVLFAGILLDMMRSGRVYHGIGP